MAKGSRGGRRSKNGGKISASAILSENDMIVERGNYTAEVDEVLTVSRDFYDEYGDAVPLQQFLIAELKPGTPALGYYDGANIAINKAYMSNEKMGAAYANCVKSGYHPGLGNKTAMAAVTAHEFGHAATQAVGAKLGMNIDGAATKICNEARKQTGHKGVVKMAAKISGYAKESNAEAVAEAFCDVYCNGKKAKKESRAIVNIANSYLK